MHWQAQQQLLTTCICMISMNIRRINTLCNCTVFHKFTWPTDLREFGRFNLVYGQNGSGKTTISKILRDLELRRSPACEVSLQIDDSVTRGSDFPDTTVPVRVFNKEFVSDSVFPADDGGVRPILVLGKESVEKEKKITLLRSRLEFTEDALLSERHKKNLIFNSLDQYCKGYAKLIKKTMMGPDAGSYNSYNMTHYKRRAQKMLANGDEASYRLGDAERAQLIAQHRASPKEEIRKHSHDVPDFTSLEGRLAGVLSRTVVSDTIQSLREDSEASEWVHRGLGIHRRHNVSDCIFCGQSLSPQRMSALDMHFNSAYDDLTHSLDRLDAEINGISKSVAKLEAPDGSKFYEQFSQEYDDVRLELKKYQNQVHVYLDSLKAAVSKKRTRPFDRVTAGDFIHPRPDCSVLERLDGITMRHNQACRDHAIMAAEARRALEGCMVADGLDGFRVPYKHVNDSDSTIRKIQETADGLHEEITHLEKEIAGHRRPAEELNLDLRAYLGHGELQLTVQDHGYAIARNGIPTQQLSEGETTAIALLYFLKSLDDHRFDLQKGVVVLDDPVSSLDANALFLAHGFIQERTKNAGQLFILTHNLTFLRQTRNWFRRLNRRQKGNATGQPAMFYMLECEPGGGRNSSIRTLDPLLERYESDYHYLFACVWRTAQQAAGSLEENYALPNMARRLLEAFLAFKHPDESGRLWDKMQGVAIGGAKRLRILRFVNEYSHGEAVLGPEYDPSLLGEASSVLSDLLDLIKSEDRVHFDRMVALVKQGG